MRPSWPNSLAWICIPSSRTPATDRLERDPGTPAVLAADRPKKRRRCLQRYELGSTEADSGPASPGKRSDRSHSAGHASGRPSGVGDESRTKGLARTAGRRVPAAHQCPGRLGRTAVVTVHATDRSGGVVPRVEERTLHPAVVPPEGAAGQGPRDGGFSGLCPLGDLEASAQAQARDRPPALGQRCRQRAAVVPDEGAGTAKHGAKRRYCPAHHGWARDPSPPDHGAFGGAELAASSARSQPPATSQFPPKM